MTVIDREEANLLRVLGYRVEERGSDDAKQRVNDTDLLVLWWTKGMLHRDPSMLHWKCDGPSMRGGWFECIGSTLAECLRSFRQQLIDEQNEACFGA